MSKRIIIISCLVALIFALCAVNIFADEHEHTFEGDYWYAYCLECMYVCDHFNATVDSAFEYEKFTCYYVTNYCPDCKMSYTDTFPHYFVDGKCSTCGYCDHIFEDGYCNNCNSWCEHNFTDGVCNICAYKCLHSVGYTDSVCNECGITCTHIFDDGICGICGIECVHNWIEYDRKHTHNRNLDCYTSFERCEYCDEEWSNGYGHNINDYNVCIECNIYMICLHEWFEEGQCIDCGWICEHNYDGWGNCHTCGMRCQHTNKLTLTDDNSIPSVNGFCWFSYEKCLDCNYVIKQLYYPHTFENGKCDDCGITLEEVTCKHNILNITDEGFTHNQNSYCFRIIERCSDCHYIKYRDVTHEFYKGKCKNCDLEFVSGLEQEIYDDAYTKGKNEGYEEGKTDGYEQGKTEGYEQGKNEGYEEGKTIGIELGKPLDWDHGYAKGKEDGFWEGYNEGMDDAEKQGFGNLFYQLFDAEVKIFQNMLSFEIFGINIASFIISIMSILIIAFVFKKVF